MLIKNGRIIDPSQQLDEQCDILIQDGKIMKIAKEIIAEEEVIDATGWIVAPGFVDVHVHFRDPGFTYKEDLETGSRAGAKGGFTSVICMANTNPIIDNAELLRSLYDRSKELPIHVYFASAVSKGFDGKTLCDYEELIKAGAICFTDDGKPLSDTNFLKTAMSAIAKTNQIISLHEELPEYVKEAGIHAGTVAKAMGLHGAMREAEWKIVERDIAIAKETNARMHVQHISSKEAVELVRKAKAEGLAITAEATPHHFTLTHEAINTHGTLAKMNPPLREESDRLAIIEGLKDGTIDVIATDHAPHSVEEKNREFTKAPSGITGLETSFSLGYEQLVKAHHLSLSALIDKMSVQPAQLFQLPAGSLKVGAIADLVLIDLNETYKYDETLSKASNSPFMNQTLQGKVKMTIVNGTIVYQDSI